MFVRNYITKAYPFSGLSHVGSRLFLICFLQANLIVHSKSKKIDVGKHSSLFYPGDSDEERSFITPTPGGAPASSWRGSGARGSSVSVHPFPVWPFPVWPFPVWPFPVRPFPVWSAANFGRWERSPLLVTSRFGKLGRWYNVFFRHLSSKIS